MKSRILALVAALLPIGMLVQAQDPATLRVGFVVSLLREVAPSERKLVSGEFKDLVKKYANMDSVVLEGLTPATAAKQLEDKKWHLGIFHGVEFAWVQSKFPNLRPLMIAPDIDAPVKSVVVAKKTSNVNSSADLKGKQVVVLDRLHCRLFKDKLTDKEKSYFAGAQETRNMEQALNAVLEDKAAGAIVDTSTLKYFQNLQPGRFAQLKILQESEPFPPTVIVYRQGVLSDALLKHLVDSMLKVNKSDQGQEVLRSFHVSNFQTVPADFQQSLSTIVRTYPNPQ